ncbi:MAG TPA: glycosyltransferase family 2 protein [Candidatus Bathyarchaeia archaeon]|nr:glycosyltransferase family 2 protein [Candidatus Bathyarchaeia archaeon]
MNPQPLTISIIIPVRNEIRQLTECLHAIAASSLRPRQIIVTDDASAPPISQDMIGPGIELLRFNIPCGPSCARNRGARKATGDILLFIDADILIKPDTLFKIQHCFKQPRTQAVIGVFDPAQQYPNFFSDYKNLWMNYTYQQASSPAGLFFTSIAAIRKDIFMTTAGFDEHYTTPNTEDTAFGNVLLNSGITPMVIPDITVSHQKVYSFLSLLKTDIQRSCSLLKIRLRLKSILLKKNLTSVPPHFIVSTLLTGLALVSLMITRNIFVFGAGLVCSAGANYSFWKWLYAQRGLKFTLTAIGFVFIDHLAVWAGLLHGLISFYVFQKRF